MIGGLSALFGGTRKRKAKGAKRPRKVRTSKAKKGTRKGMRRKSARRSGLRLAYDFAKPRKY
jgi:hypothetical protein